MLLWGCGLDLKCLAKGHIFKLGPNSTALIQLSFVARDRFYPLGAAYFLEGIMCF